MTLSKQLRNQLQGGEIALLGSRELQIFDEINAAVKERLKSYTSYDDNWYAQRFRDNYNDDDDEELMRMMCLVSTLEKDIYDVIGNLKKGRLAKLVYAENYPNFSGNRKKCIDKLLEIADSLNSDRYKCNVSKLAAYSTSFLGGGMLLTSAILIPFTLGLTAPLAIAGGVAAAAGTTTALGVSITEFALLKSKVDKAKLLIKEDQEHFENIKGWLDAAGELNEALSRVLSIDVLKDLADSVKKLVHSAFTIKGHIERFRYIQGAVNDIFQALDMKQDDRALPVVAIASFITVMTAIFLLLLNNENRLVFDGASFTVRCIVSIVALVDDSMDVVRLASLFRSTVVARAVVRGAVAAVGMILDTIGIILTSIDVYKGSLSPEAEKIREAAKRMQEEADILQRIYNDLSVA